MPRNVVVFCLDSVRKDYFDDYARRIRAAADLSFDRWYASSSWTVASHGSMFTSLLPSECGVNINNLHLGRVDLEETFLAELGTHWTLCASANGFIDPAFGVDSLFDEFASASSLQRFSDGINLSEFKRAHRESDSATTFMREALTHGHPFKSIANGGYMKLRGLFQRYPVPTPFDDGARLLEREVQRTVREHSYPMFVYVNFMETHGPHQPSLRYNDDIYSGPLQWSTNVFPDDDLVARQNIDQADLENFRSLYAAAIEYLDRRVMRMIDICRTHLDGETTFVVTADHGENLGYEADDFRVGHEASLSESVIHVPMEIINPPAGDLPDELRLYSHRDFGELVTGLAHDTWTVSPRSMVATERLGTEVDDSELNGTDTADVERMIRAVVSSEQKYIWDSNGIVERYDINPDTPSRQRKVADGVRIPDHVTRPFDKSLQTVHHSIGSGDDDIPDESVERLQDLGYL